MKLQRPIALRALLFLATVSLILGGCSLFSRDPQFVELSGILTYRDRMPINPDSQAIVQVKARAKPGLATEEVVAEERLDRIGQIPVKFALKIDSRLPKDGRRYFLTAVILDGKNEIFRTPDPVPVFVEAHQVPVELILEPAPRFQITK